MKSKLFLLSLIIALVGIEVSLNYGEAQAQQDEEPPEQFDSTKAPIIVEFSNYLDRQAVFGGDAIDGWLATQALCGHRPDMPGDGWPINALFYGDGTLEVDALVLSCTNQRNVV